MARIVSSPNGTLGAARPITAIVITASTLITTKSSNPHKPTTVRTKHHLDQASLHPRFFAHRFRCLPGILHPAFTNVLAFGDTGDTQDFRLLSPHSPQRRCATQAKRTVTPKTVCPTASQQSVCQLEPPFSTRPAPNALPDHAPSQGMPERRFGYAPLPNSLRRHHGVRERCTAAYCGVSDGCGAGLVD